MNKDMFFKRAAVICSVIVSLSVVHIAAIADTGFTANNFIGTVQNVEDGIIQPYGDMRWISVAFEWSRIEPKEGEIDREYLDKCIELVSGYNRSGIKTVPILGGTPGWAANKEAYSYQYNQSSFRVGELKNITEGMYRRDVSITGGNNNQTTTQTELLKIENTPLSSAGRESWKKHVEMMVKEFGRLGVEYYQIWDEPHPVFGNYYDSVEHFMEFVHKPAADIIKNSGAKTVYGGWANQASVREFVALLDETSSWKSIDVYNLHYQTLLGIDYFYRQAVSRGIQTPFVWASKIGNTPIPSYVPSFYPKMYAWSLNRAQHPEQFKIFWNKWSEAEAQTKPTTLQNQDGEITQHGAQVVAFAKLFAGSQLEPFGNFKSTPVFQPELTEASSSIEGFLIDGKKAVFAIHLLKQNISAIFSDFSGDTMHLGINSSYVTLDISGIKGNVNAKRVDMFGNERTLNPEYSQGSVIVKANVQDNAIPGEDQNFPEAAANINSNQVVVSFYIVVQSDQDIENGDITLTLAQFNSAQQETVQTFDDMEGFEWAEDAIDSLSKRNIIKGTSAGKFEPSKQLTRAEFTTLLVRTFKFEDKYALSNFTDIKATDWYYTSVASAQSIGIFKGIYDRQFNGEQAITREDAAAIVYRFCMKAGIELPDDFEEQQFNDADNSGRGLNRAEASKIIHMLLELK